MEHLRRWGLASRLRERAPLSPGWSQDVVFCTSLAGRELSRFTGVLGLVPDGDRFPEVGQQAPQYLLEELLREVVHELPACTLATGAMVTDLEQDAGRRPGHGRRRRRPGALSSKAPTCSDATARAARSASGSVRRTWAITRCGRTSGWCSGRPACGRTSGTARLFTTGSSIPTRPRWSARSIRRHLVDHRVRRRRTTPANARPGGSSTPQPGCQPAQPCCPPIRGQRACRSPTGCARTGSSWPVTRLT